mgnify:CR=1 FL=1
MEDDTEWISCLQEASEVGSPKQVIEEGQALGEIRKDFSPIELAFYLTDGFAGATTRMQAGKTDKPLKLFMKTTFSFLKV